MNVIRLNPLCRDSLLTIECVCTFARRVPITTRMQHRWHAAYDVLGNVNSIMLQYYAAPLQ